MIPNGIEVEEFVPLKLPRSGAIRVRAQRRCIPRRHDGSVSSDEDHANFLQAAALLSTKHQDAQFVLIGRGVDHENRVLRRSLENLGLTDRTHLLGERHDMPRLAAALDIFSLSSAYGESFPNVIGEAMACEVACVVTDVGDAHWIVGDAGRVVPPRDSRALAEAWEQMIELGAEGRTAIGRAARARVIERFT